MGAVGSHGGQHGGRGDDVSVDGARVHLTPREYDLLRVLAMQAGKVLTHRMLLRAVWGADAGDSAALHSHIYSLRALVDSVKPAHADVELRLASATSRIGLELPLGPLVAGAGALRQSHQCSSSSVGVSTPRSSSPPRSTPTMTARETRRTVIAASRYSACMLPTSRNRST